MPTVTVSGTTVPYRADGDGPSLVLLHGTSGDAESNFGHLVDRFTDQRTVAAPDYAGSGRSTLPDNPLTLDLLVDQAAAVIRDSSPEPADLVGFSMGAVVAAATAARHPDLVRRLVLIAGWASNEDPRHQLAFSTWRDLYTDDLELFNKVSLLLAFGPQFVSALGAEGIADMVSGKPPAGTLRQIELDLQMDIRSELTQIHTPTLVVGTTHDYLVPVRHAVELHEAIAGSRYVEVDSGHVVLHEQPDRIVELLREFLLDPTG